MASDRKLAAVRAKLDALGERRQQLDADDEALMKEVEDALGEAFGLIPVTEAADRLHMHRTTVYRVYRPHAGPHAA